MISDKNEIERSFNLWGRGGSVDMKGALRYAGKYVKLARIFGDCSFDVASCSEGNAFGNFPHNVFQRIENTTVEFRDNMWKIRNLCVENKETELEALIASFPSSRANKDIDRTISKQQLNSKHQILRPTTRHLEAYVDAVLNNTNVFGLDKVTRSSNAFVDNKGDAIKLYTGNLELRAPLINGTIYVLSNEPGKPKSTQIQVHTTSQEDIVFKFEVTCNSDWKRILYAKISYQDESFKFLPASIDCPFDLYPVCQKDLQPLADSVFSSIKQELLWIMETRIKNAKIE